MPGRRQDHLPVGALLKVPRQARALDTVHTLLDAAVVVLNQGDPTAFTTNRVAEVAGVSVGSLYQYFASKEALLAGVLERGVLDVEARVRDMVLPPDSPIDDVLATTLDLIIAGLEPYGTLLDVILSTSPLLSRNGILPLLEPRLTAAIHRVLLTQTERRPLAGGAGVYVGVNSAVVCTLRWLAERPPWLSREALVAALVRQSMAHLEPGQGQRAAAQKASGPTSNQ